MAMSLLLILLFGAAKSPYFLKKKTIYVGAKGTQINYTHESTEVEEGRRVELAMGWSVSKTSTMNSENK